MSLLYTACSCLLCVVYEAVQEPWWASPGIAHDPLPWHLFIEHITISIVKPYMHTWKIRPSKVTPAEPLKRRSQLGWNRWVFKSPHCSNANARIALDSPAIPRGCWCGVQGSWSATGKTTTINSNTHTTKMQTPAIQHLTIPPFLCPGHSSVIHLDVLSNVRSSHLFFFWLT